MINKLLVIIIITCASVTKVFAQERVVSLQPLPPLSLDTLSFGSLSNVFSNEITSDINVVGVGASSFTLSESARFSNKLIQYLVMAKGFKAIALPMDDWRLRELNLYLTNGKNMDSNETVAVIKQTFNQSVYYTEETSELMKWVKEYNIIHRLDPVQFMGISLINPVPLAYLLAKYVMPADSATGVLIAKVRASSRDDSKAYDDILSWYSKNNKTIKGKLGNREYTEMRTDMENLHNLKKLNSKVNGIEKMNYSDSCLIATVFKLRTENKKLILCGDNKMISRTLTKTDITRKGFGMLLHDKLEKTYYTVLTDYYNLASFYWVNPKSNKLEKMQSSSAKTSTSYILHKKYRTNAGLILYDDLIKNKIPISFNVHDLYDRSAKSIIQHAVPAFDALVIFNNENPIRFLKRSE